jgi:hypothetical protein
MRFGGRENKFDRWRRFFQSLQQRVERIFGDLVNFIDDVNLKSALSRLIADIFDDLANLIDAAIGRTVDFENVDRIALGNLMTLSADATRSSGWPIIAIQRLGENSRCGCFAYSAHAGEQKCVWNPIGADGVLQGSGNMLLPGDIRKGLRTPFPCNHQIRHRFEAKRPMDEADSRLGLAPQLF